MQCVCLSAMHFRDELFPFLMSSLLEMLGAKVPSEGAPREGAPKAIARGDTRRRRPDKEIATAKKDCREEGAAKGGAEAAAKASAKKASAL